ncbi:hypothetical protein BKH46_07560 [Helicobacter sp. 12S02634-8]|uniref:SLAC1 anion channel family protein n=1 Tax=Helicobacter sp. 12S02634-8 TaxID=1476199 RepID=UPI000BA60E02|nr:SLAC1 anion channel family protein [Helicobacter sp. 12S02634-8]PAF46437.1 hypothetical protein BKH46_07560 [Helicobacter sp. 12S02634-8]
MAMGKNGLFGYLPVSLFGSVMGLCGLGIAWELAWEIYDLPFVISQIITLIAVVVFVLLLIAYGLKCITRFDAVRAEFTNPLLKGFFGTFIISLLLLPIGIYHYTPHLAFVLWGIGVVAMLVFAWHMVSFWFGSKQEMAHITPAWIIPVVGTLDIPLAAHLFDSSDGIGYLNILSVAIGLFFAIPIMTLILYKIMLVEKLPDKLKPSLMILIAPFAVGFSAYLVVVVHIDLFALGLFFLGVFVFLTLLPQYFQLTRCCPFRVTWWAVSFPLSALLVAALKVAQGLDNIYFHIFALFLLAGTSLVLLWLLLRTLKGVFDGELENLS